MKKLLLILVLALVTGCTKVPAKHRGLHNGVEVADTIYYDQNGHCYIYIHGADGFAQEVNDKICERVFAIKAKKDEEEWLRKLIREELAPKAIILDGAPTKIIESGNILWAATPDGSYKKLTN